MSGERDLLDAIQWYGWSRAYLEQRGLLDDAGNLLSHGKRRRDAYASGVAGFTPSGDNAPYAAWAAKWDVITTIRHMERVLRGTARYYRERPDIESCDVAKWDPLLLIYLRGRDRLKTSEQQYSALRDLRRRLGDWVAVSSFGGDEYDREQRVDFEERECARKKHAAEIAAQRAGRAT